MQQSPFTSEMILANVCVTVSILAIIYIMYLIVAMFRALRDEYLWFKGTFSLMSTSMCGIFTTLESDVVCKKTNMIIEVLTFMSKLFKPVSHSHRSENPNNCSLKQTQPIIAPTMPTAQPTITPTIQPTATATIQPTVAPRPTAVPA